MGGAPRSLGPRPTRSMMTVRSLRQFDRADFASLAPFDDGDSNGLALRQTAEPSAFQGRAMHEKILGFALDRDEAEALHGVIPFTVPSVSGGPLTTGWRGAKPPLSRGAPPPYGAPPKDDRGGPRRSASGCAVLASTLIFGNLRPFLPLACADHQRGAGFERAVSGGLDRRIWRKASPDPSVNSTKPKPFSALNHFTLASVSGPPAAPGPAEKLGLDERGLS